MDCRPPTTSAERNRSLFSAPRGYRMTGKCQYILWHRCNRWPVLGYLAMGTGFSSWSKAFDIGWAAVVAV
jgi:hypothetical protein